MALGKTSDGPGAIPAEEYGKSVIIPVHVLDCKACGHILAHVLGNGKVEVRHKGLVVINPENISCPKCGMNRHLTY